MTWTAPSKCNCSWSTKLARLFFKFSIFSYNIFVDSGLGKWRFYYYYMNTRRLLLPACLACSTCVWLYFYDMLCSCYLMSAYSQFHGMRVALVLSPFAAHINMSMKCYLRILRIIGQRPLTTSLWSLQRAKATQRHHMMCHRTKSERAAHENGNSLTLQQSSSPPTKLLMNEVKEENEKNHRLCNRHDIDR